MNCEFKVMFVVHTGRYRVSVCAGYVRPKLLQASFRFHNEL